MPISTNAQKVSKIYRGSDKVFENTSGWQKLNLTEQPGAPSWDSLSPEYVEVGNNLIVRFTAGTLYGDKPDVEVATFPEKYKNIVLIGTGSLRISVAYAQIVLVQNKIHFSVSGLASGSGSSIYDNVYLFSFTR